MCVKGKNKTKKDMELPQGDEMDDEEKKTMSQPQSKAFCYRLIVSKWMAHILLNK